MGFEPTIPASERAKTVHALDRAATVTGYVKIQIYIYIYAYETVSYAVLYAKPFIHVTVHNAAECLCVR
jgi:hypothetical protein